jgi:hypothetical protein
MTALLTTAIGTLTVRQSHLSPLGRCVLQRGAKVVWWGKLDRLPTDLIYDSITVHPDDYDQLVKDLQK